MRFFSNFTFISTRKFHVFNTHLVSQFFFLFSYVTQVVQVWFHSLGSALNASTGWLICGISDVLWNFKTSYSWVVMIGYNLATLFFSHGSVSTLKRQGLVLQSTLLSGEARPHVLGPHFIVAWYRRFSISYSVAQGKNKAFATDITAFPLLLSKTALTLYVARLLSNISFEYP